jgi:hypothetical protein
MALNLTERELFDFITGDFEDAWGSVASVSGSGHRGNFMFARQAVCLLEVACRLCKQDTSGEALKDLSVSIEARESRYFTVLPKPCWCPGLRTRRAFDLPSRGPNPDNQVIAALFNLIRNGQAHQYQQMQAVLADGKQFAISLTGAEYGTTLGKTMSGGRPVQHLGVKRDSEGNLWMTVRPDVLFLDIRDAVRETRLLDRGLTFSFMSEDRPETFGFTALEAETVFRRAGHLETSDLEAHAQTPAGE